MQSKLKKKILVGTLTLDARKSKEKGPFTWCN